MTDYRKHAGRGKEPGQDIRFGDFVEDMGATTHLLPGPAGDGLFCAGQEHQDGESSPLLLPGQAGGDLSERAEPGDGATAGCGPSAATGPFEPGLTNDDSAGGRPLGGHGAV